MITVDVKCPHCANQRSALLECIGSCKFLRKGATALAAKGYTGSKEDPIADEDWVESYGSGVCTHCKNPMLVLFNSTYKEYKDVRQVRNTSSQIYMGRLQVTAIHPKPEPPYSHPSLPESLRSLFIDVQETVLQHRDPAWIAAGCRKVLEEAVRALGGEGKTLHAKIEHLRQHGIITGLLADWAHHLRVEGNEAVHGERYSQAETEELIEFARLFLQYAFELPAKIRIVRERRSEDRHHRSPS